MILVGIVILGILVAVYYAKREYATNKCPACPDCPGCPACPPINTSSSAAGRFWGIYMSKNLDGTKNGYIFIPDGTGQSYQSFKWYIFTIDPAMAMGNSSDDFGVLGKDGIGNLVGSIHTGSLIDTRVSLKWTNSGVMTVGTWDKRGRITLGIPGRTSGAVFTKIA